jgi:hypothetical protein
VTPTPEPGDIANTNCIGADVGPCIGDVDNNGTTDADDLTAIILAWGNCANPPPDPGALGGTCINLTPCPPQTIHCLADIVPAHKGNNVVDSDDLITVILTWGCTWTAAGNMNNAPQTVQDCWTKCAQLHGTGNTQFEECNQKCIDSLYLRGLLP